MADFELLIIGGGLASARAVKAYREAGGVGRVALVSKDRWVPYHRPPLLDGSGIEVGNGIVVDEPFRTSAPDVWAAGDVANFYDPLFERRRRIEHWSNANYQGTQVGKALAGEDARYDTVSTFFTEVFGTTFKVFGDITSFDDVTVRGSFADGAAVAFYVDHGRFVGAVLTGQDDEREQKLKDGIAVRGPLPAELAA